MESKEADPAGISTTGQSFKVRIGADLIGMRLDQFLSQYIPSLSRTLISASIRKGLVLVDDVCRKSSYRLKSGEIVRGDIEEQPEIDVSPEKIDFPILYEDDSLLLLSKPPGLVVHPGSGHHRGTLVNGLVYHCRSIGAVGESVRPGIVHRLDKDTSGIMVVAKTDKMLRLLVNSFKNHQVKKIYLALLHGVLKKKKGRMVEPIGRHPVQRQKMAITPFGGKHAVSNWDVIEEFDNKYSLVKVVIETGRTHQIRVHMASLGCPVVGDKVYGPSRDSRITQRQLLHASRMVLRHPLTDDLIDFRAPLWPDFHEALIGLGWMETDEEGG